MKGDQNRQRLQMLQGREKPSFQHSKVTVSLDAALDLLSTVSLMLCIRDRRGLVNLSLLAELGL